MRREMGSAVSIYFREKARVWKTIIQKYMLKHIWVRTKFTKKIIVVKHGPPFRESNN